MLSEGRWGGSLSNIPDGAGYLRLAAGFSSAEFEEGDGSVGAFFGTFVALSEPLGRRVNEMGTRCRPPGGGSATSNWRASSRRVNRLSATGSWRPTEPARRVGLFRDRSPLLFKISATGGSNLYQRPVPPSGKPFSDQNICRIGALPMDFSRCPHNIRSQFQKPLLVTRHLLQKLPIYRHPQLLPIALFVHGR